jgi:HlyD family secretion protein
VPTVDRSKATVLVKIEFVEKDKRVLPDMSAKVSFLTRALTPEERKPVTAMQAANIVKRADKDVVFLLDDKGIATQTPVTVGAKIGDLVRVTGVKPGDKVVAKPEEKFKDGSKTVAAKK